LPVLPIVIYLTEPNPGVDVATSYHHEFMGQVTHQDFVVVKLWQFEAKAMLQQALPAGLLPYVPLMAGADEAVVRECARRIRAEPDHEELETILALFAMIKLEAATVERIVRWHVTLLEKSPIYQEILEKGVQKGREEGRAEELRRNIARVLAQRFDADVADWSSRLEKHALTTLEALFDEALVTPDLATFATHLTAVSDNDTTG
jgi:predicted transposase YdaD